MSRQLFRFVICFYNTVFSVRHFIVLFFCYFNRDGYSQLVLSFLDQDSVVTFTKKWCYYVCVFPRTFQRIFYETVHSCWLISRIGSPILRIFLIFFVMISPLVFSLCYVYWLALILLKRRWDFSQRDVSRQIENLVFTFDYIFIRLLIL